jgi:hypothetical protein
MNPAACWKWLRCSLAAFALLAGGTALACQVGSCAHPPAPTTMEELQRLDACQLEELYRRTEMGRPFVGVGKGRLLCATNERFPRLKRCVSNAAWRGKSACEDGYFINRWVGGIEWISSNYVIGPSWVDGKPSVVIEYEPGTPLFGNSRDELREVAPGLYFGPLYEVRPCPKLRGYLAVQVDPCKKPKCCAEKCCDR